jgi:hypothetical protein
VLLEERFEPSEMTDEHEHMVKLLRDAGIQRDNPKPEVLVTTEVVDDVDGLPLAVNQTRTAALSS